MTNKKSPLEEWIKDNWHNYATYDSEVPDGMEAAALKLLEVAEEEQRMPFINAECENYAWAFANGQRSLIKFLKRWCGKGE